MKFKNIPEKYDYVIIGAGIVGLALAHQLKKKFTNLKIAIIEKEKDVALHASGRNSGVLHAGFYYTENSLKAKLTRDGNAAMKIFCKENKIPVNETQKIVVAKNENELNTLFELKRRADINGVETKIIDEKDLKKIDQNIKTYKKALFSPNTASVNPVLVCSKLKKLLEEMKVDFYFNTKFEKSNLMYDYLINCAGLYSDKIAKKFGLSKKYTMIPFKGLYMKYNGSNKPIKTNVYPVPDLMNPFLGVHFTITENEDIKIGPTATPAFWRENYKGFKNFKISEFLEIIFYQVKLFIANSFNFRKLAFREIKYLLPYNLFKSAKKLVFNIEYKFNKIPAGIRAQLLNKKTNELVQDFIIEHTEKSTHILNAVSPGFTCAFSFAEYIISQITKNQRGEL